MSIPLAKHEPHQGSRLLGQKGPSPRGWQLARCVTERVARNVGHHTLTMSASSIAFYGMLAAFPALATFISIYALAADPAEAVSHFVVLSRVMPRAAWDLFHQQLVLLTSERHEKLGLGALFGFALTLWSAGAGVRALIAGLNIVYMEREHRGFLRFYLVAGAFTVAVICLGVLSLTTIVITPILLSYVDLASWSRAIVALLRWPLIIAILLAVLMMFYKYGASRTPPRLRWTLPGAVFASAGWLAASYLFSLYVSSFVDYNKTYGTLGAVVILLTWFYISAFLVLLGAELNAALEHFATIDTTEGPPMPEGFRGAHVADTDPEHDPLPEPTSAEAAGEE